MNISKQNKVPNEFKAIYEPLLKLKTLLQSNITTLDSTEVTIVIHGLMFMHYTSFVLSILGVYRNVDKAKIINIRNAIENILEHKIYLINEAEKAVIVSYIDYFAKLVNLNLNLLIHVCLFEGYLDFEIYYHFHADKKLFDFKEYCTFDKESYDVMEYNFNYSKSAIKKLSADWKTSKTNPII